MPSNLRIDPERLWSSLMETAAIGGTAKGGINRQTLTAEDGKVTSAPLNQAPVPILRMPIHRTPAPAI